MFFSVFGIIIIYLIETNSNISEGRGCSIFERSLLFAIKFIMNILMILSLSPVSGISLPFISYGGLQEIINMASLGLILSIYRRKDIIKASVPA